MRGQSDFATGHFGNQEVRARSAYRDLHLLSHVAHGEMGLIATQSLDKVSDFESRKTCCHRPSAPVSASPEDAISLLSMV